VRRIRLQRIAVLVIIGAVAGAAAPARKHHRGRPRSHAAEAILWRNPADIATRNLYYGAGGRRDAPSTTTFFFIKEDLKGTNPKYVVRDATGTRWKIKLGPEARPEIATTRLVWAAGYFTNEDYFLPRARVEGLPAHLHRGRKYIGPGGMMANVRLKRYLKGEKKIGDWRWRNNPFTGTSELYGLRVMMALLNSWDLKDDNNSVYRQTRKGRADVLIYMVSDLGSSLGTTGQSWSDWKSKGNINSFRRSKFISRVTPDFVDFNVPTRPALNYLFVLPEFITDVRSHWVGRRIPRAQARRMGHLLAQLSPAQIRDAFHAVGFPPAAIAGYAAVIEARINELNRL
jgi:hypothetical protein